MKSRQLLFITGLVIDFHVCNGFITIRSSDFRSQRSALDCNKSVLEPTLWRKTKSNTQATIINTSWITLFSQVSNIKKMLFLNLLLSRVLFNYLSKYYCPGPWTQIRLCPFFTFWKKENPEISSLLCY